MKFQENLKRIFLSFFICFLISNCSFSLDKWSTKLSQIEKSYYGFSYENESITKRLTRLEKDVYGITYNKPQNSRIEKLYKDLDIGVTGAAAPNNNEQNNNSQNLNQQSYQYNDIGPEAEAGIKYPIVDKLEEKTFGKNYQNEDIYKRLSRLEKKVFKKESTNSLNDRVSALRDKLLGGETLANANVDTSQDEIILDNGQKIYGDSYSSVDLNNPQYNYYSYENSKNRIPENQSSYDYAKTANSNEYADNYDLDILEKSLFGTKYSNETSSKRLARMESKLFNRTFSDSDESRIQRLLAVTTAQKTSQEYDSNKWAQRLNTGIQIGSILLMVLAMIL